MKKTLLLSAALTALLLPLPVIVAHAQTQSGGVDNQKANTRANRKAAQAATVKEPAQFPNAKREDPKPEPSKVGSKLNDLNKLVEAQKNDEAIAMADEILANPKATGSDRAFAAYYASAAWRDKDTTSFANSITYMQKALDANGMTNNAHYGNMLQLAAMLKNDERYAEALVVIDRYLTETASEDPKAYDMKGDALFRLNRHAESNEALQKAIAGGEGGSNAPAMMQANYKALGKTGDATKVLEDMVAKKPNDKVLLQNLASAYRTSNQDAKAVAIVDRMRAGGMLTEAVDYDNAINVLMSADGHEKDATALMNEGLKKGVLKEDFRTFTMIGQTEYNAGRYPQALDAWSKAAPLAPDGETYLNVAKLQRNQENWPAAKAAAKQALAKGLKKKGDAWILIAAVEQAANNEAGSLDALREAAKYPETKKEAQEALRQAGAK
jgi:tetratricopeptide (TPR) repeat protein